jgi:hypothetical protein
MLEFHRPIVLQLAAGELLQWREWRPVRLRVVQGRVWVTRANDLDDHFLEAGESIDLAAGARAIVEAEGPVQVALAPQPSRATRMLDRLRAVPSARAGITIAPWISPRTS